MNRPAAEMNHDADSQDEEEREFHGVSVEPNIIRSIGHGKPTNGSPTFRTIADGDHS